MKDTLARNNSRGFFFSDSVKGNLDNVRTEQNGFGVRAAGSSEVIVRNSVMSGNTAHGIAAVSTGAPIVNVTVENTISVHNGGAGVLAQGHGATVHLSQMTIAQQRDRDQCHEPGRCGVFREQPHHRQHAEWSAHDDHRVGVDTR